jgi:hydroxymethylpyrimidine pyrophosphatase-like HAD family hydrolase
MIGPAGPNDAVMFDIDDTLIWTSGQANAPIIQLLHRMKALGYRIVIITARPGVEIGVKLTIKQLKDLGIHECTNKNYYEKKARLQLCSVRR